MIVHAVVDYSFLYYKYKFQLESGKMRRLSAPVDWKGTVIEKDISQIYYSIKEIEGFRRSLENAGHNVFVSVCFDMPSARKQGVNDTDEAGADKYKSNRTKKLTDNDFENIQYVEKLLSDAGYNTYRFNGYEADDIIAHLVTEYKNVFDYTVIYTPDLDLLVHVCDKVGCMRYKVLHGYQSVDINNVQNYLSEELKCTMPLNGLTLYKSTVGDKSDCIDGIRKFGPKAFDKLVAVLNEGGINWEEMNNWMTVETIIKSMGACGYFTQEQTNEALNSLSLVRPMTFGGVDENGNQMPLPVRPIKHSTRELREASYMRCNMKSLIE